MNKGTLFVITGPSGAGKGTVLKKVFNDTEGLAYSVSATTRSPREGETDGVNYYFVSKTDFKKMIAENKLLEYTQYAGNYYGTPKEAVLKSIESGKDILLEIELEGARNVKKSCPECVLIFLSPPSLTELESRLRSRGTETESQIQMRLKKAKEECSASSDFDYIVINDFVDKAAIKIEKIIKDKRKTEVKSYDA